MSKRDTGKQRARDCAAAWFVEMELALERGDLDRAAEARRQLERLGYEVYPRRRKPEANEGNGDNG